MRFLLDTHIWIWSLVDPGKLSLRVRKAIENPANEIWLSPISVWEMLILVQRKRLILSGSPQEWLAAAMESAPFREAPLTVEIALATATLQLPHRDPADAFLLATAKILALTLVTSDARLLSAKGVSLLAN